MKSSVIWKVLAISIMILLLMIPLVMISGVVYERQSLKRKVENEIAQKWARNQTVIGPVLAVPYQIVTETLNAKGQKQVEISKSIAYLLPQQYKNDVTLDHETRTVGIYSSIVYNSDIQAQGTFDLNAIKALKIADANVLWKEAYLILGIPDTKGINKRPEMLWQGKSLELLPGTNGTYFIPSGLYAEAPIPADVKSVPFKLSLALKGSESFSVAPIGKQNTVNVRSKWPSPSFTGNILPTTRKVTDQGFTAVWEVPYFSRNYGQAFTDASYDNILAESEMAQPTYDRTGNKATAAATSPLQQLLNNSAVGVTLLQPVDSYRQAERAMKYGALFLLLTFATYFLFEVIARHRLHLFQYLLVGCAISLFYLLLLSLSEVLPFETAYTIASGGIIALVTLYSKAILGKIRRNAQLIIGGLLTALYGYLFVLLRLEDLSLLFGTIGLFIVLAVMMYITRNIDWYNNEDPVNS